MPTAAAMVAAPCLNVLDRVIHHLKVRDRGFTAFGGPAAAAPES
jgi:hypothetical protein